jgi:hypothetical protein
MAYEITYYFHERREDGKYDTENRKELVKKVGKGFEDISLEQLAASIMTQLARRDIWVVDVNVFEYAKKAINFKEATDGKGFILKGKKFSLDKSANLIAEEIAVEEEIAQPTTVTTKIKQPTTPSVNLAEAAINPKRILHYVTYDPYVNASEAKRKGLKFTELKKYPVHRTKFDEKTGGQILYVTDDTKRIVEVNEIFFTAVGHGLVGDNEVEGGFSTPREPRAKLSYENELVIDPQDVNLSMPNLRPNRAGDQNRPSRLPEIPSVMLGMPELRPGQ